MEKAKTQSIRSMTGFGSAECTSLGWHFVIDIRSVNGRFLDFSLRCPDEVRQLEPWLREQITTVVQRGKVEMRIHLRRQSNASGSIQLNENAIEQVLALIAEIKRKTPELAAISPLELLRFPGITLDTDHIEQEPLHETIRSLVPKAIESLEESREGEGSRLASFLRERVLAIRDHCNELEQQIPTWSLGLEKRLKERLTSIGFGHEVRNREETGDQATNTTGEATRQTSGPVSQPTRSEGQSPGFANQSLELQQRVAQELGLYAVKSDVAEELSRLRAHTEAVDQIIRKGGTCGKRLDFMVQELQREANTLGSKSQVLEQSIASVDLKVLIEQMREQVQNLE